MLPEILQLAFGDSQNHIVAWEQETAEFISPTFEQRKSEEDATVQVI